jgi:transcriptional regulator with XRE-family HTH domain
MTDLIIKPKPGKIDKRTKNGKSIDLKELLTLRYSKDLSINKIADLMGYSKQYVSTTLRSFSDLLPNPEILKTYEHNRASILSYAELNLLRDVTDDDKRSKASLNNTAYALDKIAMLRRLEEGKNVAGGVTVNIEIAYQEATELSRKVRLKHAGTGSTEIPDEVA